MVDTSPFLAPLAPCLLKAFPGSRFLHVSRHPRDFVVSALARGWYRTTVRQAHWWPRNTPESFVSPVHKLIWYWVQNHRAALQFENAHPDITFRFRAEDLWKDGSQARFQLFARVLGTREAVELARKPAEPANVGEEKFKDPFPPDLEPFLAREAGALMRLLGYE
jgi:hypothetical protein